VTGRWLALLLLAAACAAAPRMPSGPPSYPTPAIDVGDFRGDFLRRQELVVRYQKETRSFDVVLQKKGNELLLLGLGPLGTKAFALSQTGKVVSYKSYLPIELPFPPRYVLNDIFRTYFLGIAAGPLADGEHDAESDGERISEQWSKGRLLERRFVRIAHDPPGAIDIRYVGGMVDASPPPLIEFDNGWLGYHLSISTISEETL
jgi:Protein of unknown function (DUF3261)